MSTVVSPVEKAIYICEDCKKGFTYRKLNADEKLDCIYCGSDKVKFIGREAVQQTSIQTHFPHDSAYLHSQLKKRHFEMTIPSLAEKPKSNKSWIAMALLLFVVILGAWGTAYELQYQLLDPPKHYTGSCPPPLVIRSGSCYQVQIVTNAQGQSVTTYIPAGSVNTNG